MDGKEDAMSTIGHVYQVQPQPPEEADTRWVDAGALVIGVEWREVDPAALAETYAGRPDDMAEIEAHSPAGGFADVGVSLHVSATADGHEYLRFDCFADEPHYHYIGPSGDSNRVVPFDDVAGGDMLPWAIERLRTRLPEMLTAAGGADIAAQIDPTKVAKAVDEVERLAAQARAGAANPPT
jgi:hypothetical protein